MHEAEDPYALYLALILHDTGRAENVREHTDGSAMLAARLCNRLQVQGPRRAVIMYLVDHHLTFWRFATTRNIEDPDVVAEFARIVKTKERLDLLLLFSYPWHTLSAGVIAYLIFLPLSARAYAKRAQVEGAKLAEAKAAMASPTAAEDGESKQD